MTIRFHSHLFHDDAPPRRRQIFDGVSKTTYDGPEPATHVLFFKDELSLEGNIMTTSGKGVFNNRISGLLMSRLNDLGIETHFIRALNMREQLVRSTAALSFRVTMHNVATGTFAMRLGLQEMGQLPQPIPEFSLRNEKLGNPFLATEHLISLGWSRLDEIDEVLMVSQRINDFLSGQFFALNIRLLSFTLEFGRQADFNAPLLIIDELSPETCSLFDLKTGQRLDQQGIKDNPEKSCEIYQEVARRLGVFESEEEKSKARLTYKKQDNPYIIKDTSHGDASQ
jgi:phosphoribosylaminoimidazole-succinocarboxamide synthase